MEKRETNIVEAKENVLKTQEKNKMQFNNKKILTKSDRRSIMCMCVQHVVQFVWKKI